MSIYQLFHNEILTEYIHNKKSFTDIAKIHNLYRKGIGKYVKSLNIIQDDDNIPLLQYNTTRCVSYKPQLKILRDKKLVEYAYKLHRKSKICAELFGVHPASFNNTLHYHNIPIIKSNKSSHEYLIIQRLTNLNIKCVHSYKVPQSALEFDIFLPDYNLAIEINGLYYHSHKQGKKDKLYHQNKFNLALKNDFRLLQYHDCEIINSLDNVIQHILNNLPLKSSKHNKIVVDHPQADKFIKDNKVRLTNINYNSTISIVDDENNNILYCMSFSNNHLIEYCGKNATGYHDKIFNTFNKPIKYWWDCRLSPLTLLNHGYYNTQVSTLDVAHIDNYKVTTEQSNKNIDKIYNCNKYLLTLYKY